MRHSLGIGLLVSHDAPCYCGLMQNLRIAYVQVRSSFRALGRLRCKGGEREALHRMWLVRAGADHHQVPLQPRAKA